MTIAYPNGDTASKTTGADGSYCFPALPGSEPKLNRADVAGYIDGRESVSATCGGRTEGNEITATVSSVEGTICDGYNFGLLKPIRVSLQASRATCPAAPAPDLAGISVQVEVCSDFGCSPKATLTLPLCTGETCAPSNVETVDVTLGADNTKPNEVYVLYHYPDTSTWVYKVEGSLVAGELLTLAIPTDDSVPALACTATNGISCSSTEPRRTNSFTSLVYGETYTSSADLFRKCVQG